MVQNKILNHFYNHPQPVHIRELSRKLSIPKTTVHSHIKKLIKQGIVIKETNHVFPMFKASQTELFKHRKTSDAVEEIIRSGLLDYIEDTCFPTSIVLFGSVAKGEYVKESDIDLFVQSKVYSLDLSKFSKRLGHEINILFESEELSSDLLSNIINGITLRGHLRIQWSGRIALDTPEK
ncbi:MAG: nucleotidyltransferase domain-containing protein [Candidatus Woesearchaeota archaeon]